MSTNQGLPDVPAGPPWSVDVLSDLHAGVYPDDISARLRARIAGDSDAAAVLSALDATVDHLSLLPTPRMPERFALGLEAAIAAESAARFASGSPGSPGSSGSPGFRRPAEPAQPPERRLNPVAQGPHRPAPERPAPEGHPMLRSMPQQFAPAGPGGQSPAGSGNVVSLDAARTRRRRWIGGLAVAAAVVAAATITVSSLNGTGGSATTAVGPGGGISPTLTAALIAPNPNAIELTPGRFQDAYPAIKGAKSGPLANGIIAAGCYAANGIAGPDILGVSAVTYEGKRASAIAVKLDASHARIIVVGPDCGVNGAQDLLGEDTVTR